MPTNQNLADRVRRCIGKRSGLSEKNMFGCLGFFLHGNLACGVHDNDLIVRLGASAVSSALREPGARPFDLSGRPMKGWLLVQVQDDKSLSRWVKRGLAYAARLPRK